MPFAAGLSGVAFSGEVVRAPVAGIPPGGYAIRGQLRAAGRDRIVSSVELPLGLGL